jgi:hypothetical protein
LHQYNINLNKSNKDSNHSQPFSSPHPSPIIKMFSTIRSIALMGLVGYAQADFAVGTSASQSE